MHIRLFINEKNNFYLFYLMGCPRRHLICYESNWNVNLYFENKTCLN